MGDRFTEETGSMSGADSLAISADSVCGSAPLRPSSLPPLLLPPLHRGREASARSCPPYRRCRSERERLALRSSIRRMTQARPRCTPRPHAILRLRLSQGPCTSPQAPHRAACPASDHSRPRGFAPCGLRRFPSCVRPLFLHSVLAGCASAAESWVDALRILDDSDLATRNVPRRCRSPHYGCTAAGPSPSPFTTGSDQCTALVDGWRRACVCACAPRR